MKLNATDMDVDIPVLEGYLNVPNQSGFSINRISKKKVCHRYCLLFKSSRHGIERLEICESKDDKNPKIITLENCVKITQEAAPSNSINIIKKTGTLTLNALTEDDLKEWLNALQNVAFRDKVAKHTPQAAIEEDNDLYCSSYGDGLFIVKLIPTDTSIRCNIEPKSYMLHLSATEMQLKTHEDLSLIIAKWPYRFIRKYGYRDGKFTFEAGRKCFTGEGVFTLDHTNPQEVFRCMSAKMKSMKKLISGENSIDCGENQLNAVASMEAGSRSPLPPSPSKQHAADFENSINSASSLRGLLSSSDSLNNFSINTTNTNSNNNSVSSLIAIKHVPNKPPRKLPTHMDKLNITNSSANNLELNIINNNNNNNNNNHNHSNNINNNKGSSSILLSNTTTTTLNSQQQQQSSLNCDHFKTKFQNYDSVAITSSMDPNNKNINSTVLLKQLPLSKSASPETSIKRINIPPSLPLRNNDNKTSNSAVSTPSPLSHNATILSGERDYECIETITDAWKTLGLNDVKHNERLNVTPINNEGDLIEFVRQQRAKSSVPKETTLAKAKIIDIDIGEGIGSCHPALPSDVTYDRLDFLTPNNKTSSGYKTIVTVSAQSRQARCSPTPSNDYELIATSPDILPYRKADDSHLGYGILRKSSTTDQQQMNSTTPVTPTASPSSSTTATAANTAPSTTSILDHRNYNGLNYTVVSKPKTV